MLPTEWNTETRKPQHSSRWRILAILAGAIFLAWAPMLLVYGFFTENGRSTSDRVVFVLVPAAYVLLLVLLPAVLLRMAPRLVAFDRKWCRWSRSEFTKFWLLPVGILMSSAAVHLLADSLDMPIRTQIGWEPGRDTDQDIRVLVWLTLVAVFLGPLAEEIFWRGYVLSTLSKVVHPTTAVVTQAILFAAWHLAPALGFVHALLFGLVLGAWRHRRRTLLPLILVHIANNSIAQVKVWHDGLESRQINVSHDYAAEFLQLSMPVGYDSNDDARDDYAQAAQRIVELPPELEDTRRLYPAQWTAEQRARALAWLASNAEALALIEQGSRKATYWPRYEFPNGGTLPYAPDLPAVARNGVFALCLRAELNADKGRYVAAISDIQTCCKVADHLLLCREAISRLTGCAALGVGVRTVRRIAAHEDLDSASLVRLQDLLAGSVANLDARPECVDGRLCALDAIQRLFTDDGRGSGRIPRAALATHRSSRGRYESAISILPREGKLDKRAWKHLDRRTTTVHLERYYELLRTALSMSPRQYERNVRGVKGRITRLLEGNVFIKTFHASIEAQQMPAMIRVDLEATVVVVALRRYHADNKQLPDELAQLVTAGYLDVVPDDPYSDGPLAYKRTGDDFILYSHGADFDDDGGQPSKWGRGEQGGDHVFWPVPDFR